MRNKTITEVLILSDVLIANREVILARPVVKSVAWSPSETVCKPRTRSSNITMPM